MVLFLVTKVSDRWSNDLLWSSLKLTSEILLFFLNFLQNICLKQLLFGLFCIKMNIFDNHCHSFHSVDFSEFQKSQLTFNLNFANFFWLLEKNEMNHRSNFRVLKWSLCVIPRSKTKGGGTSPSSCPIFWGGCVWHFK